MAPTHSASMFPSPSQQPGDAINGIPGDVPGHTVLREKCAEVTAVVESARGGNGNGRDRAGARETAWITARPLSTQRIRIVSPLAEHVARFHRSSHETWIAAG